MASWELIAGKVYVMLNAHYRTCNLTPKHVYVISHTRTCTLPCKHDMMVKCECLCVLNSAGGQQCRANLCGVRANLCGKNRKHRLFGPAFSSDNAGDGPEITIIPKRIVCLGKKYPNLPITITVQGKRSTSRQNQWRNSATI